jgi:anti-sigma-K factor RskA
MASATVVVALGATVYSSANVRTSSSLRHSKRFPRAAITASANSVATPSLIAAATSSEDANPAPFNASLSAAEAVSNFDVGLIN